MPSRKTKNGTTNDDIAADLEGSLKIFKYNINISLWAHSLTVGHDYLKLPLQTVGKGRDRGSIPRGPTFLPLQVVLNL